jgi:hypothetical protein
MRQESLLQAHIFTSREGTIEETSGRFLKEERRKLRSRKCQGFFLKPTAEDILKGKVRELVRWQMQLHIIFALVSNVPESTGI